MPIQFINLKHLYNKIKIVKLSLTIIFVLIIYTSLGQAQHLFKITHDNKVGYINEKGSIVINPIFLNGNDFSEGLAAVRLNGTYGFINETGEFVIKPQFDFASNFEIEFLLFQKPAWNFAEFS